MHLPGVHRVQFSSNYLELLLPYSIRLHGLVINYFNFKFRGLYFVFPLWFRFLSHLHLFYLIMVSVDVYCYTRGQTTLGRTPLDEVSAMSRDLNLTTHNPHYRQDVRTAGRTGTPSLSKRTASDRRIRPRGHQDRRPVCHVRVNVLLQSN